MSARRYATLALLLAIGCHDEPAIPGGACVGDCWTDEPSTPLDAGSIRPDAGTFVLLDDAGAHDAAADDIDAGALDAGARDAGARDAGARDAGPPRDAGARDAAPRDAGPVARDGGAYPDAGAAIVPRGTYGFTRRTVAPIPTNAELTHIAIAPDGRSMIVSERYDRLHVIALPAETYVRAVVLPKVAGESLAIAGMRYAGSRIVIAATAYAGGGTSGRIFRTGPQGEGVEAVGPAFSGVSYESVDGHPSTAGHVVIAGRTSGALRIYSMDPEGSAAVLEGQAPIAAGCQDAAPVLDGLGRASLVYACGMNGGAVGEFDGATFQYGPATTNTSHVASRPQRDYALFVNWSAGRLLRYEAGTFTVGSAAPELGSIDLWDLAFSDDGQRALITGEMIQGTAQLREYRDRAYSTNGISDVSIPNFDAAPWSGANGVVLWEAAWRPGSDCGYVVGGCGTAGCQRGYLVAFEVLNGRPCP